MKTKVNKKVVAIATLATITLLAAFMMNRSENSVVTKTLSNYFAAATSVVKSIDHYVIDGQGPFEDNDNPGNDSSQDNKIVRANDILVYTLQPFVENKSAANSDLGKIVFEAKLPKQKLIFWNVDEIKNWAGDSVVQTEDSQNYYLKIVKRYDEIVDVSQGNSTLNVPFAVKVLGAKHGTQINPEFTVYMEGAEQNEKQTIIPETVRVSAEKRYIITIEESAYSNREASLNGEKGRLLELGVGLMLENPNDKKGLKGIEFPDGKIEADFKANSIFQPTVGGLIDQNNKVDITNIKSHRLYNYGINARRNYELGGSNIPDFNFKITPDENRPIINNNHLGDRPMINTYNDVLKNSGVLLHDKDGKPYAGDVNHELLPEYSENGNFRLTFSDYKIDENTVFPTNFNNTSKIKEQRGYISFAKLQVLVPMPEKEWVRQYGREKNLQTNAEGDYPWNIDFTVTAHNIRHIAEDGTETPIEDKRIRTALIEKVAGRVDNVHYFRELTSNKYKNASEFWNDPKFMAYPGEKFFSLDELHLSAQNDESFMPKGITQIYKFDPTWLELDKTRLRETQLTELTKTRDKVARQDLGLGTNQNYNLKVTYLTKLDGSTWANDEEMSKTHYEGLKGFATYDEAQAHGTIVGIVLQAEVKDTEPDNFIVYRGGARSYIPFKFKEDAPEGYNAPVTSTWYGFFKKETQGSLIDGTFRRPTGQEGFITKEHHVYKRAEYEEDGLLKPGTHTPQKHYSGATITVVKAMPKIEITPERTSAYNLTRKETKAIFKVTPILDTKIKYTSEEEKDLTMSVILPKGLIYKGNAVIGGTFENDRVNGGTPIEAAEIVKNEDGTTTVKFKTTSKISPEEFSKKTIHYETEIPLETPDQTNFITKATIDLEGSNLMSVDQRSHTSSITIINLLAQVVAKELDQQIIENGEEFNYKVKYLNQGKQNLRNAAILDILPFNGDDKESRFNGTYKIKNIASSRGNNTYYTNDVNVRTKDARNFKDGITWTQYTGGEVDATAIYTEGAIEGESKHELTFTLKPVNSRTGDVYGNRGLSYADGQLDTLNTPVYKGIIARRTITGKVFKDLNLNGIKEANEPILPNRTITLLTEDGQRVRRVDGTIVEAVRTGENGNYVVFDVPPLNNMKLQITYDNNVEEITKVIDENKADRTGKIEGISMLPARQLLEARPFETKTDQDFAIIPKVSVKVNKVWVGGLNENRPAIKLQLKKNGVNHKEVVTVNTDNGKNNTSYTFTNLDVSDDNNVPFTYTVDEVDVPANYTKSLSNDTLTVTNTYVSPKTTFTGTKKFVGGATRRPEFVELKVLRNGQEMTNLENKGVKRIPVNSNTDVYTVEWDNLDLTDSNGIEYNYTVEEINIPKNFRKSFENNNKTVVNTYVPENFNFILNHIWINGEVLRKDIRVQLYQNGKPFVPQRKMGVENDTTIYTIPKTDDKGNAYTYRADVSSVQLPDFVKTVGEVTMDTDGNTLRQTITDEYTPPFINVKVEKNWDGGINVRPDEIQLQLYKNGKPEGEIFNLPSNQTIKIWENLPAADLKGNKFTYSVDEVNVPENYNKEVTVDEVRGTLITNTYVSPKRNVTVTKSWINGNTLRKDIQLQLVRNGQDFEEPVTIKTEELNNNSKSYTFTDLDRTDNDGTDYEYSVRELSEVENFTKTENGLNVTNEYVIPKTSVKFKKTWVNYHKNVTDMPDFTVALYRDGVEVEQINMTDDKSEHTFENLDETDLTGRKFEYEVKEIVIPENFTAEVEKVEGATNEFNITNTFHMPTIDVIGHKMWIGGDSENRPVIDLILKANGEEINRTSLETGTTVHEFKAQPKFDDFGKVINYEIAEEIKLDEYKKKNNIKFDMIYSSNVEEVIISDETKKLFNVTNTYMTPVTKVKVRKVWIDADNFKPTIKVQLFQNGEKFVKPVELKDGQTEHTFDNLEVTDIEQNVYEYSVDEVEVPEGYTKSVAVQDGVTTITNTKIPKPIVIETPIGRVELPNLPKVILPYAGKAYDITPFIIGGIAVSGIYAFVMFRKIRKMK